MFFIKIADLVIKVNNIYEYSEIRCKEFIVQDTSYDFEIVCTKERIQQELVKAERNGITASPQYCEFIIIHNDICNKIVEYGGMFFHAALIQFDGRGYAFAAPSGVGKSTHVKMWVKHFHNRAVIINGDKPLIRIINGKVYAYGTPWCGKENYYENARVRLNAICFIGRGENNIRKIDSDEAINYIFPQIYKPNGIYATQKTMAVIESLINAIEFYVLNCDVSTDAVMTAYNAMCKERDSEN
ncbi:MAG: hypothetical protein ACI4DS_00470 [Eubacterium sp.]